MSTKSSPQKSPQKSASQRSASRWQWWYKGCLVQQIYLVISIIAGIILGAYTILIGTMKIHQTGYNKNDALIKLFEKYKVLIISYLILSFIISFVINNFILVQYCNLNMKGWKNVVFSLALFFGVAPAISWVVSNVLAQLMLKKFLEEAAFANLLK